MAIIGQNGQAKEKTTVEVKEKENKEERETCVRLHGHGRKQHPYIVDTSSSA